MSESRRLILAFTILALCLLGERAWGEEAVLEVRLGLHPDGTTRLVLDLAEPTPFRIGLLAAPDRLYIELPSQGALGKLPKGRGLIRRLSLGSATGLLRLTAELSGPVTLTKADLIAGTGDERSRRLVVDLAPASAVAFATALAAGPIDSDPPIVLGTDQTGARPAAIISSSSPPALGTGSGGRPTGNGAARGSLVVAVTDAGAAADAIAAQGASAAALEPDPRVSSANSVAARSGSPLPRSSSPTLLAAATQAAQLDASPALRPYSVPMLRPGSGPVNLPLIYIDPGHGGDDPGTVGRHGVYEKDITIAVAKELQRQILASGRYRVKLTRESDRFVALRDRFEMARKDHADLFLSLHADSNPFFDAKGATVYTLSETASDAEAEALATKENKSDLIDGVDLSNQNLAVTSILIDLAQRETKNRSAAFAELLVHDMGQVTLMLRNSHRFAGFAVLKAPDIPSVLVELGYLSDSQDEALLLSPAHRAKLAAAMLQAIDGYYAAEMVSGTRS